MAENAPRLEVEWWRVHRELQHVDGPGDDEPLAALKVLYAAMCQADRGDVLLAARERADAMRTSDAWARAGADPTSPLVAEQRAVLVRSYAALLAAVHPQPSA